MYWWTHAQVSDAIENCPFPCCKKREGKPGNGIEELSQEHIAMKSKFDKHCKKQLDVGNIEAHLTMGGEKKVFKFDYYMKFMDTIYYWKYMRLHKYVTIIKEERRKVLTRSWNADKEREVNYGRIFEMPIDQF